MGSTARQFMWWHPSWRALWLSMPTPSFTASAVHPRSDPGSGCLAARARFWRAGSCRAGAGNGRRQVHRTQLAPAVVIYKFLCTRGHAAKPTVLIGALARGLGGAAVFGTMYSAPSGLLNFVNGTQFGTD